MGVTDAFLQEIDQEGKTTRRVLERVPTNQLGWKPHAKSMSLGTLAKGQWRMLTQKEIDSL